MVTDPPYNVDYASADGKTIQNDSMGKQQFVDFLTAAFRNANEVMRPGAAFYIWHASSSQMQFEQAINEAGMDVRQQLIWVKNSLVLGRQDYQWMHEPCFYGWKDGAAHYFVDDRKQTTVIHEDKPTRSELHPTMKPIKLIERLVKNSSRQGENVLDLFGGSGTTLVTCEQINRKCYMMELDEKYCDVIINRWESLTGERAQLV
jgi:site-specific DNA-methyltransferase (adenine-specific)